MAGTSDSGAVVVCEVLCFMQNKVCYVPFDTLGSIVKKGFKAEEVERAKSLIFEAASKHTELSHLRKKTRKCTGLKPKNDADVDDILQLLVESESALAKVCGG